MNEYKSFRKKIKIQIRLKIDTKSEKTNDIKEAERFFDLDIWQPCFLRYYGSSIYLRQVLFNLISRGLKSEILTDQCLASLYFRDFNTTDISP